MKRKDEAVYECQECGSHYFVNTLIDPEPEECEEDECGGELVGIGWRDELGM